MWSGPRTGSVPGELVGNVLSKLLPTGVGLTEASGERSSEAILSVIRAHTPGLRHVFEKYLKLQPGFKGKVTLRLTIAPNGAVIELALVSSTTGSDGFDGEIREMVKAWRFEPIHGANEVVTVPFSLSQ